MTDFTVITLRNGPAIWGAGDTEAAAWADWRREMAINGATVDPDDTEGREPCEYVWTEDYVARDATEALVRAVQDRGGVIDWAERDDGVLCLASEAD